MERLIITKTYDEDFNTYDYQLIYGRVYHVPEELTYEGIEEYVKQALLQLSQQDFETYTLNDLVIVDRSI